MRAGSAFHTAPIAAAYDLLTGHAVWRRAIDDLVGWASPSDTTRQALDLGCGPGESAFALARALPAAEVVGIDFAAAMVRRAERRRGRHHADLDTVRFEQADAVDLPFADRCFDLAIGHSFLYLVADRPGVLRETHRVLRPGGVLALMEPADTGSLIGALRGSRPWAALRTAPTATLRFATSMVLWRVWSASAGRLSGPALDALLRDAGFVDVACRPTLGRLGWHCRGRRPA